MNDIAIIALVGVIALGFVALTIVCGLIVYKLDILHLKSYTNVKTDLLKGQIEAELSVDIEKKNAKENSGLSFPDSPLSSKHNIR